MWRTPAASLSRCALICTVMCAILGSPVTMTSGVAHGQPSDHGVKAPLELPAEAGGWVVELRTVKGVGLINDVIGLSSGGAVTCGDGATERCDAEQFRAAGRQITDSLRGHEALPPWSDTRLFLCSDCPRTVMTIYRRESDGRQSVAVYRWAARSSDDLPEFVKVIHSALTRRQERDKTP